MLMPADHMEICTCVHGVILGKHNTEIWSNVTKNVVSDIQTVTWLVKVKNKCVCCVDERKVVCQVL